VAPQLFAGQGREQVLGNLPRVLPGFDSVPPQRSFDAVLGQHRSPNVVRDRIGQGALAGTRESADDHEQWSHRLEPYGLVPSGFSTIRARAHLSTEWTAAEWAWPPSDRHGSRTQHP
jgi:hypothetical protein